MTSVFDGLKFTSHCLDHWVIDLRSEFNTVSISIVFWEDTASELSSAKSRVVLKRESAMSLTYIKNKRAHKTEPWGTPAFKMRVSEKDEFIKTRWLLFER